MTVEKTILTSMAEKYRLAERLVFAKLKPWQQQAITEDRKAGNDSGLLHQFCQDVMRTAENMVIPPEGSKPPVVHTSGKVPWPKDKPANKPPYPQWHDKTGANGYDEDNDIGNG